MGCCVVKEKTENDDKFEEKINPLAPEFYNSNDRQYYSIDDVANKNDKNKRNNDSSSIQLLSTNNNELNIQTKSPTLKELVDIDMLSRSYQNFATKYNIVDELNKLNNFNNYINVKIIISLEFPKIAQNINSTTLLQKNNNVYVFSIRYTDGQTYILKIFDKSDNKNSMGNEIEIMEKGKYGGIIKYINHSENDCNVLLFMEYASGGDLRNVIKCKNIKKNYFKATECELLFIQILISIHYIHNNGIIHRDIKSANIFLSSGGLCKLGDFGFSIYEKDHEKYKNMQCGTPYYMAPEIWKGNSGDKSADMWALGVLLYEMIFLSHLYEGKTMKDLKEKITENRKIFFPHVSHISQSTKSIIHSLLVQNKNNRPNINELFQTPYIKQLCYSLSKEINPSLPETPGIKSYINQLYYDHDPKHCYKLFHSDRDQTKYLVIDSHNISILDTDTNDLTIKTNIYSYPCSQIKHIHIYHDTKYFNIVFESYPDLQILPVNDDWNDILKKIQVIGSKFI